MGDEDLNKDDPGDEEPNKDDGEEQVVAPGDDEGEENLDPEVKQPEDENDQDPDEEKENQVDESGEVDKPEEEPEPAQGMLRAAPPTRAVTLNWELKNYPSPSYSDNRVWIYGRNVTYEVDNGVVTGVVEIQVVPVRSDYYKFYGSDIRTMSQSNPNSSGSFPFAQYMDATVADSDGNILATSEDLFFYSPNSSTSPAKLEAGKTYTLTLRFKDIYAYYQDIGDNLSLVKISALTRHNYVNGKCDACYDEYPEDMYSP